MSISAIGMSCQTHSETQEFHIAESNSTCTCWGYMCCTFFYHPLQLFKATEGFSPNNLIGQGSYGSVFKGILDGDGIEVAVKVLNLQNKEHQRASWQNLKPLETFDIRI